MFRSSPLDAFQKKLHTYIDHFHAGTLTDSHKNILKIEYRKLSVLDKRSIHLDVKARTMGAACATPNLMKTGLGITVCVYLLTIMGNYLNSFRCQPIPSEHIVDTNLDIALASMLLVLAVGWYHRDNFLNLYNKPAHIAALALFDEAALEEKREAELYDNAPAPYELGDV